MFHTQDKIGICGCLLMYHSASIGLLV